MEPDKPIDPTELLKEKSLFEIWIKLRKSVKEQKFNVRMNILWMFAIGLHISFSQTKLIDLLAQVRTLCELGFGFGASILGFLLAGFAIFASMTKPDMLLEMARQRDNEGLSRLKRTFFSLVEVFIVYLIFVIMCVAIRLFSMPGGGLGRLISLAPEPNGVKLWLARIAFWIVACLWLYTLLKLKSFIFNVYHFVMAGVAWEAHKADPIATEVINVNGERAQVLDRTALSGNRTSFNVILEANGRVETFISPPAVVTSIQPSAPMLEPKNRNATPGKG